MRNIRAPPEKLPAKSSKRKKFSPRCWIGPAFEPGLKANCRAGDFGSDWPATDLLSLKFVAHDCDLALITVSAPDVFKNMTPLKFGGIPELESTVSAYGYPIGGERMSVTAGIVSRIDFQLYAHSSIDSHLAIQISAQIDPGNNGGPVMPHGNVIGLPLQGD